MTNPILCIKYWTAGDETEGRIFFVTLNVRSEMNLVLRGLLMDCLCCCRDMSCFASNTYDAIIDKGTLDAILCGENSVTDAKKMLLECYR